MTFFNDSRKDMIQLDSSWIPQNSAKVYSRGIETGVTLGLPRNFNLALNHTWNEHYDQDNRPLIRRAKTKFKATLTHTLNKKLDSLVSIYVRGRATGSASNRHTGGFTTVRATLGYQYNKNFNTFILQYDHSQILVYKEMIRYYAQCVLKLLIFENFPP